MSCSCVFLQVKHTVESELSSLTADEGKAGAGDRGNTSNTSAAGTRPRTHATRASSKLASRVAALQRNPVTFCEDPVDLAAFQSFCADFSLPGLQASIDELLQSNAFMRELHARLVPHVVDETTFWQRYFFRCVYTLAGGCIAKTVQKNLAG